MKTMKREDRRALIAYAVLDTVAEHGLGRATLRNVARAADVSMGMVQHHFPSTATLLRDSLSMGLAELRSRINHQIGDQALSRDPQAAIKAIALAHLDNDESVTRLLRAIAQFRATSEHDGAVRELICDNDAFYTSAITTALWQGHERRLLHQLIDPELEGPVFWALINALATDVALSLRDREEARALLRYHFVRLARNARITTPPRHPSETAGVND